MAVMLGRVHIIGIGGAGMSGLARLLMAQGIAVSGSDAKESRRLSALKAEGATVFVGHDAAHLLDSFGHAAVDTVAASTAVPANNPELEAARNLDLRILTRADLLCAITDKYTVASVAGTHGKTTTTSMLTVALQHAALDPSFAIGSELNETGSNAHLGSGQLFVVEADECAFGRCHSVWSWCGAIIGSDSNSGNRTNFSIHPQSLEHRIHRIGIPTGLKLCK